MHSILRIKVKIEYQYLRLFLESGKGEDSGILAVIFHDIKLKMLKLEGNLENPPKLLMLCKNLIRGMASLPPLQNICIVTHTHMHTRTHTHTHRDTLLVKFK